jgi:hypothetical protein
MVIDICFAIIQVWKIFPPFDLKDDLIWQETPSAEAQSHQPLSCSHAAIIFLLASIFSFLVPTQQSRLLVEMSLEPSTAFAAQLSLCRSTSSSLLRLPFTARCMFSPLLPMLSPSMDNIVAPIVNRLNDNFLSPVFDILQAISGEIAKCQCSCNLFEHNQLLLFGFDLSPFLARPVAMSLLAEASTAISSLAGLLTVDALSTSVITDESIFSTLITVSVTLFASVGFIHDSVCNIEATPNSDNAVGASLLIGYYFHFLIFAVLVCYRCANN